MKKKLFISFTICVLTMSCNDVANSSNTLKEEIPTTTITVKDFDFNVNEYFPTNGVFKYSEIFSNVEYVKLQSNENSTIGNISKMEVTNEGDYIIFDLHNGKIARFNSSGIFLNQIGCRGKGKHEYLYPIDFVYNPFDNQIIILDMPTTSLKFYKTDGTFIRVMKFDFIFKSFGIIDKDYIAICTDYAKASNSKKEEYNFKIYDMQGNLVSQYDPYNTVGNLFGRGGMETFKYQNGHLLCNPRYSSVIYSFNQKNMFPLYRLDFGKKTIPNEIVKEMPNSSEMQSWLKKNENTYCVKFFEGSKNYVMLLSANGGNIVIYLQDKKDAKKTFAKTYGYNDLGGIIGKDFFTYFHNDTFYYVLDPSEAQSFLEQIESNRQEIEKTHGGIRDKDITILKEISNHTNPIIQICTLK